MNIRFSLLINNGQKYTQSNLGIAICDYADLLAWKDCRDELFWQRVEAHYHNNSNFDFQFNCMPTATIADITDCIVDRIGFCPERLFTVPMRIYILVENELIRIDHQNLNLSTIFKHYSFHDNLHVFFMLSNQAGDIWKDDGIRYYMHSRESGRHNAPHIHVDYKHEYSASICIFDGSLLDGHLPAKVFKKAQARIMNNQKFLLKCWNKKTDGLTVDINHYFGITPLEVDGTDFMPN